MAGAGSGYDTAVNLFSTDGRVFQVEYASKAVDASSTVLGVCCTDGVLLAVEKLIPSKMLEPNSNTRLHQVDYHCGVAICGLIPDGKAIAYRARAEAQQTRDLFHEPLSGSLLAERLGEFVHLFTTHFAFRPFGAAVAVASFGDEGPLLYVVDPSGTIAGYHGCALGKGKTTAKTQLEKVNFSLLSCRQAVQLLAGILHDVHDGVKDKNYEIEMAWVCEESERKFVRVPEELVPPPPGKDKKKK